MKRAAPKSERAWDFARDGAACLRGMIPPGAPMDHPLFPIVWPQG